MTTLHHPDLPVAQAEKRAFRPFLWAVLVAAAMAAALWTGWIGFMASDDSLYHAGALRWLIDPPFPGSDHWSTRFPLTLTFAAVLAVIGQNYVAFGLTAVLFYVVLVAATGRYAATLAGARAGWIAALLTATLPVVVSHASTVSIDLIEAAALLIGAMLVGGARDDAHGLTRAAMGGMLFGIAILCRETSLLALAALGPMFLIGRPLPRRVLIACGVGAAAVLLGEALFQYALTGDPLRRYTIAFHHDEHIDRAANREGNFLLWPPIDPLLVLLINDDFGLLFWIAGAALAGGAWRMVAARRRSRLVLLAAMAGVSFLLVSALYSKLVLNPRYFMLAALFAVILVSVWLDRLGGRARGLVLAVMVGSSLLLMSVGNAHPRWSMEALVAAAQAYPDEMIAGDAGDARRATLPLALLGQQNIRFAPVPSGGLVVTHVKDAPAGEIVAHYPSPPTRLGGVVRMFGLEALVPAPIARRVFAPSPAMVLVRTPAG